MDDEYISIGFSDSDNSNQVLPAITANRLTTAPVLPEAKPSLKCFDSFTTSAST